MSRILVLDDDQSNADAIQAVLEDQAFEVMGITQSDKLTEAISIFQPDLIVMDILLDHGDGREICNVIKLNDHTCNIPILLITAMLESQAEKIPNMADGIIFKPFDYFNLCKRVRRLIN